MEEKEVLIVTPEYLIQKAEEWEKAIKTMETAIHAIETQMQETKDCFVGKTAEYFQKGINKKKEQREKCFLNLKRFSESLRAIGLEYERAEGRNSNVFGGN